MCHVCTRAGAGRGEQDLLWFRVAAKEEMLFAESQKVLPGLMDMIMCGCGGNAYAVAVTNKRIIIQNDKRCLFGSTTLTTNEESFFLKNVHKANLNTDGALNLGICTLHSAEMLTGGFNWIFFGFIIDLVLEWKPTLMDAIDDDVCVCIDPPFPSLRQGRHFPPLLQGRHTCLCTWQNVTLITCSCSASPCSCVCASGGRIAVACVRAKRTWC